MDDISRRLDYLEAYIRRLEDRIRQLETGNAANSAAATANQG